MKLKPETKARLTKLRERAWEIWVQIGNIFTKLFYAFLALMAVMIFVHLVWAKMDIEILNRWKPGWKPGTARVFPDNSTLENPRGDPYGYPLRA